MDTAKVNHVTLSKRMSAVAAMVTPGRIVADIGCDHGFVSIYLIEQNIALRVIAMDVNDGPLLRAKEHVKRQGLDNKIDIRKSDGLEKLNFVAEGILEASTVVIAGMGGRLTVKILSDYMDKLQAVHELILEPQSDLPLVREFLWKNGFVIFKEDMVEEEGKYYQIIKAVKRGTISYEDPYTEYLVPDVLAAKYGPILLGEAHPVMEEYLLREKNKFEEIKKQMITNGIEETSEKMQDVNENAQMIKKALLFFV